MKKITGKQLEVMQVLWGHDGPLTASEIGKLDDDLNINTVQASIRQLLKNKYIKVADIVYSGTVLSRRYEAVVARSEYIESFFSVGEAGLDACLNFITGSSDMKTLSELEKAISEKKKKLKEE